MDAETLQDSTDPVRATSRVRVCKRCKFSCTDAKEFGHHQMHAHQEAAQINACDQCDFRCASYTDLQRHQRAHRQSTDSNLSQRKPSLEGDNTDSQETSVPVDDGNNNNIVAIDKKQLTGLSDVNSDSATDDETPLSFRTLPTRTYVCKLCGIATNSAKRYLHHLRDDHGEKKFPIHECDTCDYASRYKQKLARHRRSHFSSPVPSPKSGLARSSTSQVQVKKEDTGSAASPKSTNSDNSSKSSTPVQELLIADTECTELAEKALVLDTSPEAEDNIAAEDAACDMDIDAKSNVTVVASSDSAAENATKSKSVLVSQLETAVPVDSMVEGHKTVSDQIAKMASMAQHVAEGTYRPQYKGDMTFATQMAAVPQSRPLPGALKTFTSPDFEEVTSDADGDSPHKPGSAHTSPSSGTKTKNYAPFREAVDPAKYVSIQEPDGVKYACSKCGNVYKWRKSLNKHWKEKHEGELPEPRSPYTPLSIPKVKPMDVSPIQLVRDFPSPKAGPGVMTMVPRGSFYGTDSLEVLRNRAAMKTSFGGYSPMVSPKASSASPSVRDRPQLVVNPVSGRYPSPNIYKKSAQQHHSAGYASHRQRSATEPTAKMVKMPSMPGPEQFSPIMRPKATPPAAHSSEVRRHKQAPLEDAIDLTRSSPVVGEDSSADDCILDLSMKGMAEREAREQSLPPPPQNRPIDFSRKPTNDGFLHPGNFMPHTRMSSMDTGSTFSLGLQCPSCSYTARNKFDYDKHMEVHLRRKLHKCAECQQSYHSLGELNEHFQLYHMELIQAHFSLISSRRSPGAMKALGMDPGALQNLPQSTQLYKYLTADPSKQPLTCVVCGAYFQWQWTLAKHFEQDHSALPNPYKKRDHSASSPPGQSMAVSSDALKRPPVDAETSPSASLSSPQQSSPGGSTYQCSQCTFVADNSSELTRHQLKHSIGWQMKCELCSFSTKWVDGMQSHYSVYHPEAPYTMENLYQPLKTETGGSDQYLSAERAEMVALAGEDTTIVIPEAPEDHDGHLDSSAEMLLPYKCSVCEYRARWPSEITQHMKNHSDEKPYHCPRCSYKSKWKWDVVKHLKRCGGGSVKDVVDTTKLRKQEEVRAMLSGVLSPGLPSPTSPQPCDFSSTAKLTSNQREVLSSGPPNVTVMPQHSDSQPLNMSASDNMRYSQIKVEQEESDEMEVHTDESNQSVITDVQNFCDRCPFVGHSPAELKRHTRVHSDEKPFICQTCGYCSKWKCDLKKHLRTYNHVSAVPLTYGGHGRRPADWQRPTESTATSTPSSINQEGSISLVWEDENIVYGCNKCRYITPKKALLDSHMKTHLDPVIYSDGHLKCKQCNFEAADLSSLIQHKIAHSTQEALSPGADKPSAFTPSPSKHRRKPQFVMKATSSPHYELDNEGGDSGTSGVSDHFNRSSDIFNSPDIEPEKSALLAALGLEVTAKVRELQQQQQQRRKIAPPVGTVLPIIQDNWLPNRPYMNKRPNYKCSQCPYATDNRTTFEKHVRMHNTPNRYRCEWCNWSTDRLNLLYRHAQSVHPDDLATEEKESFYDKVRGRSYSEGSSRTNSREGTPSKSFSYMNPASPLENLANVAASLGKHADREISSFKIKTEMLEASKPGSAVNTGTTTKPKRKLKACSKCAYVTDNVTTLNRHVAKHGFNGKFKCHHCDYCVNKAHIIKYHLRTVHGEDGGQPPAKKLHTSEEATTAKLAEETAEGSNETPLQLTATDDEEQKEKMENGASEEETDEYFSDADSDEVMTEVTTKIRGQEMRVIQEKGKTLYGCTKCSFTTGNVTNAISHGRQHGSRKKYRCEHCDYSLDQLRHMVHHMKNFHPEVPDNGEDSASMDGSDSGISDYKSSLENKPHVTDDTLSQITPEKYELEQTLPRKSLVFPIGSKPLGSLFRCRKCVFVTPSMATFVKHKNFHKIRESKFACEQCGYRASTGRLLEQHIRTHCPSGTATAIAVKSEHPVTAKASTPRMAGRKSGSRHKFECQLCPFMTYIAGKFQSHLSCHRTRNKYTCEHCSYSVHRADHLQRHKVVHLLSPSKRRSPGSPAKKPLKCSQCPYSTHSQSLLDSHNSKNHQSPCKQHSCQLSEHERKQAESNNNNAAVLPLVNGLRTNGDAKR